MRKINVSVIAAGQAAQVGHIRWYVEHPDVETVSISDPSRAALNYCASRWKVETYSDHLEMLRKEKPDAVSICSPVSLHHQQVVDVAEAGAHILCEKPMARTLEECDQMINAASHNNINLMIGFHKRQNQAFQEIKTMVSEGEIGIPHLLHAQWTNFDDPERRTFRHKLETGGGVFQDHGSHYSDLYMWWVGPIKSVEGELNITFPETHELEDGAIAVLRFENGAMGLIELTQAGPETGKPMGGGLIEKGEVYGDQGSIRFSVPPWTRNEPPTIEVWNRKTGEWKLFPFNWDMVGFKDYQYKKEIDHFVWCVKNDARPSPDGRNGRAAIEVVLALYQSWYTGKRVNLPLAKSPKIIEIMKELRREALGRK